MPVLVGPMEKAHEVRGRGASFGAAAGIANTLAAVAPLLPHRFAGGRDRYDMFVVPYCPVLILVHALVNERVNLGLSARSGNRLAFTSADG